MAVKIVTIGFLRDVVAQIKERFIDPLSSGKVDKNSNASLTSVDLPTPFNSKVRIMSDSILEDGETPTVTIFHNSQDDRTANLEVTGAVKADRIQSYVFGNPDTKVYTLPGTTGVSSTNHGGVILTTKFRSMSYTNGTINLGTSSTGAYEQSCGPNGYTALKLQGDSDGIIRRSLQLTLAHESNVNILFRGLCDEHWVDLNLEDVVAFDPRPNVPITITFSDSDALSGVQWINGTPPWDSLFGYRVRFHIINGVGTWETVISDTGDSDYTPSQGGNAIVGSGSYQQAVQAVTTHNNQPFQWILIQPIDTSTTIRKPIWYTGVSGGGVFIDAVGSIITGPTTTSSEEEQS